MKLVLNPSILVLFLSSVSLSKLQGPTIVQELTGGVYKTQRTKGSGGEKITSFHARLISERPVYNVVELDLNRGESITITCPATKDGIETLFPSSFTTYYRRPPNSIRHSNTNHFMKTDLLNELLREGDGVMGLLEDLSNSLILIPYGKNSRRLSFLSKGNRAAALTTMYFICLKEYISSTTFEVSALIAIRVIPDVPSISIHHIALTALDYLPKHHDLVYTKEYSPVDDLVVKCKTEGIDSQYRWKLLDFKHFPHNILVDRSEHSIILDKTWREHAYFIDMDISLEATGSEDIRVTSKDLSSIFHTLGGDFYISCTNESDKSNRIFHLVGNTVSVSQLIKPEPTSILEEGENVHDGVPHYNYHVIQGEAVAIYCPIRTHKLDPPFLISDRSSAFETETYLNFPNTKISKRGNSLAIIDFSNTSVLNSVKLQIKCTCENGNLGSYVFSLSNHNACIFDDSLELRRPCKVVLFPSEDLWVKCPRKSDKEYYGLTPEDIRDGYIQVDDSFVKDRHAALSRTVIRNPTGDINQITFLGHKNRSLIRDEIHFLCAESDSADYKMSENSPTVIVKLVGQFEEVDDGGKLIIKREDLLLPSSAPKLFYVLLDAGISINIHCTDFFADGGGDLLIYPSGKWEVFDDIPHLFNGLIFSKVKANRVHESRAIKGLKINKFPQCNPSSVSLELADDYRLTSRSDNAMYFVCAKNDVWDDRNTNVAVIQVYIPSNTTDLYGVGVKEGLFRLENYSTNSTYSDSNFNLFKHKAIAMHCPKAENDLHLPQCYDLSVKSDISAKGDLDGEIDALIDGKEMSGFQSLWLLKTEILQRTYMDGDVNIICYCLAEDGTILAKARLSKTSNFTVLNCIVGIIAIVLTAINE
ncbi:hypothetical protein BgAZ_106310 [Babesia gibsoni]|uniref:6-Cys domain-containing protein n=1 Tax=Babesia gibsoni TaxID=33632 RepID=A0AAD8PGF1_BABGI|nr:hypothetical protein BgAZ_106310 [Babesia gibsoni]